MSNEPKVSAEAAGEGAKVIPVGHSYSVAIGSLGIKLFESLADAQEVRDAINKAIAAAVSQGGVERVVPHQSGSSDIVRAIEWLEHRCDYGPPCGKCHYCTIAKSLVQFDSQQGFATPPDTDEIEVIRERNNRTRTDGKFAYFTPGELQRIADIGTLLTAYDALKGENERLRGMITDCTAIEMSLRKDGDKWQRAAGHWKATSEVADEELSRLRAAVPTDEVKEQDNES